MEELERLKTLKAELQTRRETYAAEVATWGKCADKAEWKRREAHLADIANNKARLKKTNLEIAAEEKRLSAERPPAEPRVKKPKQAAPRGPRLPTTGQVIRRVTKRLVSVLEGLQSPTEETRAFLPIAREFLTYQEEHVAWQQREWASREAERDG